MGMDPKRIAHLEHHARTASFASAALFALSFIALVVAATPMKSEAPSFLAIIPVTLLLGAFAAGSYAWALRAEIRSAIAKNEAAGM